MNNYLVKKILIEQILKLKSKKIVPNKTLNILKQLSNYNKHRNILIRCP